LFPYLNLIVKTLTTLKDCDGLSVVVSFSESIMWYF